MKKRPGLLYLLCLLSAAAGCMPVIFAYPKIQHIPKADVNSDQGDVRAFLVTTTYAENPDTLSPESLRRSRPQTLTPLALSANGHTVSYNDFHFEASALVVGAVNYGWSYGRNTAIVLYRPGYKLVTLRPGQKKGKIPWEAVDSLAARERVIDDLLAMDSSHPYNTAYRFSVEESKLEAPLPAPSCPADKRVGGDSESGMLRLPGQREVMLFAAGEYERLAAPAYGFAESTRADVPHPFFDAENERAGRLQAKAQWLKTSWMAKRISGTRALPGVGSDETGIGPGAAGPFKGRGAGSAVAPGPRADQGPQEKPPRVVYCQLLVGEFVGEFCLSAFL